MKTVQEQILRQLTHSAQQIIRGNYQSAHHLFDVTINEAVAPEYRDLAETMGMMAVKVEAREFDLKQKIEEIQEQKKELERTGTLRAESGFLFCSVVLILSVYMIVFSVGLSAGWFNERMQTLTTVGLLLILLVIFGISAWRHHHPWAMWGLTWKGGRRAVTESLLWCIPWALALIGFKWWLVRHAGPPFSGLPVFNKHLSGMVVAYYFVLVIGQEVISRGFIQSTLERVLTGKYRGGMAILTASVLFAVGHLHYSSAAMLAATIFSGFFFGWLYRRHQTLVGVTIAHFLLGTLVFDVLDLITGVQAYCGN